MSRVIVVGGGVIGLACACELRARGAAVVLIDRDEPGGAASSGNAGWITPALSGPVPAPATLRQSLRWLLQRDSPLYIRPWADRGLPRWLWSFWKHCNLEDYTAGLKAVAELNKRTMRGFDELEHEGLDFEMRRDGILFAFLTESGLRHAYDDIMQFQPYGYRAPEVLDARAMRALEPTLSPVVAGGFLVTEERHARPEKLTASLLRRLSNLQGEVRVGVEVLGVHREGRRVTAVETTAGSIEGDQFLLAAGAWSAPVARRWGIAIPIQAGKGYSITISQPRVQLRRPILLGEAKVGCTPFDGALRVAGTMELAGLDLRIPRHRLNAIRRSTARFVPGWQDGGIARVWAGLRPMAPDGLPLLGRVAEYDNVYVATGHGMLGVTLAPATGAAMAELICDGRTPPDLQPFDPARFTRARRQRSDSRSSSGRPSDSVHGG